MPPRCDERHWRKLVEGDERGGSSVDGRESEPVGRYVTCDRWDWSIGEAKRVERRSLERGIWWKERERERIRLKSTNSSRSKMRWLSSLWEGCSGAIILGVWFVWWANLRWSWVYLMSCNLIWFEKGSFMVNLILGCCDRWWTRWRGSDGDGEMEICREMEMSWGWRLRLDWSWGLDRVTVVIDSLIWNLNWKYPLT